ncbi:TIGR04283 family arsenosugar biosynthesis glycosyltransferase [Aliivibrio sp. S4TY2]|uniref:TIGR04283 family arsenosugar biosynthesis glycosyltransferase n=1 Tax=unclassified Aliivibrio TaxID=2645654 RepID=UPI002379E62C|nr:MULTISPECIES: TIGR04283 family arsenosugar biosynthesis glycosyltransferase [unclassified Aliivibrio]MDD9158286.1 TIGR04283 family arsenosugar biosynthesis glycosyltransferase [Aliivibrio sp. S4TY2]MDD9162201.1 TIGR04283 family arsenosugar biosynthesis glycosyltransferase [Aliivibrio sp. S4TY1]MDD9166230.1 TIGR04283 family arsenosugar biosynthesis glycosyltransferase [Aliivibrio sp. S4MY2]MDD9170237.1 TIGR04283 family arsenosugar biosynthesis glycosyltransferase [Aliivibrio sp. S4MY4]MDD918
MSEIIKELSIIVPILNEKNNLNTLIEHLNYWQDRGCEIIIVDGGSQDGSVSYLNSKGLTVISSPKNRSTQMNIGALYSSRSILLFLHADTQLPKDADDVIIAALKNRKKIWGRFNIKINSNLKILRLVSVMVNFRSALTGIATGDQAIFVRRSSFNEIGHFVEQPLMEDIELSKKLCRISTPICLKKHVTTSGRRWENNGVWYTIFLMWKLRLLYWLGSSAKSLAKEYR